MVKRTRRKAAVYQRKGERDMEDWLKSFYTQTDPVKRQQLLLENTREMEKEADQLRKQLFEARYGKGKPRKDAFMGCLMNLKYIVESGGMDWGGRKKKLAVEVIHDLGIFEFEQKTETEQELIRQELKNTCRTYIEVSTSGRGFTSVIFGIGQLSDEGIAGKIAEQLSRLAFDAPHILRMEKEFEPLQRAAVEAFREIYPDREHFLKKR